MNVRSPPVTVIFVKLSSLKVGLVTLPCIVTGLTSSTHTNINAKLKMAQ